MRLRARTWFFLSLLLCGAGAGLWHRFAQRGGAHQRPETSSSDPTSGLNANLAAALRQGLLTSQSLTKPTNAAPAKFSSPRLANTTNTIAALTRSDRAVLLRNAFIETVGAPPLVVPEHLRAQEDPGSYIVQARGAIDEAFRAALRQSGAAIVSYIPNNAYLVRVDGAGARQIGKSPRTQAVLPFEPYFKLDDRLLKLAVAEQPLPESGRLTLTLFADNLVRNTGVD